MIGPAASAVVGTVVDCGLSAPEQDRASEQSHSSDEKDAIAAAVSKRILGIYLPCARIAQVTIVPHPTRAYMSFF
jgi:hypothetical protein